MTDVTQLGSTIASLTLGEANELAKLLEEEYGLKPIQTPTVAIPLEDTAPTPEPDEFRVTIVAYAGNKKIPVIKAIRAETSLGLKEAKNATENLPFMFEQSYDKEGAEKVANMLKEAGAEVTIEGV